MPQAPPHRISRRCRSARQRPRPQRLGIAPMIRARVGNCLPPRLPARDPSSRPGRQGSGRRCALRYRSSGRRPAPRLAATTAGVEAGSLGDGASSTQAVTARRRAKARGSMASKTSGRSGLYAWQTPGAWVILSRRPEQGTAAPQPPDRRLQTSRRSSSRYQATPPAYQDQPHGTQLAFGLPFTHLRGMERLEVTPSGDR
jgi:hypothetical protein